MGFLRKNKGTITSEFFKLVKDINETSKAGNGNMVDVSLYEDHLTILNALCKSSVTLNYDQITDVQYTAEIEKIQSDKSVIGRAALGGLLFGGAGAIVGAVSGGGKKEKRKLSFYFIIAYRSSSGEDKFIVMEDTRMYRGRKVATKLKELCGFDTKPGIKEESL